MGMELGYLLDKVIIFFVIMEVDYVKVYQNVMYL